MSLEFYWDLQLKKMTAPEWVIYFLLVLTGLPAHLQE